MSKICSVYLLFNLLHIVCFYTPPYTKDYNKTTIKGKNFSLQFMAGWKTSLFISCEKTFLCQFFSEHVLIFLAIFNQKWKKRFVFKFIFIKLWYMSKNTFQRHYLLLHKNITCIKVKHFQGTTLLMLPLYFLDLINCYNIKNDENNCMNHFKIKSAL